MTPPVVVIEGFTASAVIFGLDGVITDTASVHAAAWKELFDGYLRARSDRTGEPFAPFDRIHDYAGHVDGKSRFEGVRSFLAARGIELREGYPEEGDTAETIVGLGLRKDRYFVARLADGVPCFPSSVQLLERLKEAGVPRAVVSPTHNCVPILGAAGLVDLFDTRVDGLDADAAGLHGKPEPDIFLAASDKLGVEPRHCAVIEDTIVGVQAGSRGGFGLVVGVDRLGNADALRQNGADVVVADLEDLDIRWPDTGGEETPYR
ncbi:MAG TPA: HAD-IA family hydrolase [Tepidiformaceae bacterium]